MLKVLFTLDYEIHGNGEGDPLELMVEPTARMLDQFDRYGAKLTILADVAEILKFREYREQFGKDDYHYEPIARQLREAVARGHDVQLHLHASYFNARFHNGSWEQDWSAYNFAGLPYERLDEIVRVGKDYLETLLRPTDPAYRCFVFRAANWAVSPSRNVVRALLNNGIRVDTSVFKFGRREGLVSFDYSRAHSNLEPWPVCPEDICRRDDQGVLHEVPIYAESRWIGAFVSLQRLHRVRLSRRHRVAAGAPNGSDTRAPGFPARLARALGMLVRRHAWKADFNQCTGTQLVGALKRAEQRHGHGPQALPFVLIGHSKLFTRANEASLATFLEFIQRHPDRFSFGSYGDLGMHDREAGALRGI